MFELAQGGVATRRAIRTVASKLACQQPSRPKSHANTHSAVQRPATVGTESTAVEHERRRNVRPDSPRKC